MSDEFQEEIVLEQPLRSSKVPVPGPCVGLTPKYKKMDVVNMPVYLAIGSSSQKTAMRKPRYV